MRVVLKRTIAAVSAVAVAVLLIAACTEGSSSSAPTIDATHQENTTPYLYPTPTDLPTPHSVSYADRPAHPDSLLGSADVHAATHLYSCAHGDPLSCADRPAYPDTLPGSADVHAATHLYSCAHGDTLSYADRPAYPDTLPGSADIHAATHLYTCADPNSIPDPNPPAHTDAHSPTPAILTPQHAEYTVALQKLPRYRPPNPSVPLGSGRAHVL